MSTVLLVRHGTTDTTPSTAGGYRADRSLATLLLCLWVVALGGSVRATVLRFQTVQPIAPVAGVDPNVAPWWELSVLPRIGPSIAEEIIRYRDAGRQQRLGEPVFCTPADLEAVRGIGPRTLQRIGPYVTVGER